MITFAHLGASATRLAFTQVTAPLPGRDDGPASTVVA
jgi:hypothetical protein